MFPEDKTEPAVLNDYREPQTILWDTECELALSAAALTPHPATLPDAHDKPTQPAEFSATTPPFRIYLWGLRVPGNCTFHFPPQAFPREKGSSQE